MANIRAYVGLNYGSEEWPRHHATKVICNSLANQNINACTILPCFGLWQGEAENSLCVDLVNVNEAAASTALQNIAHELAQWEILYTVENRSETVHNDATAERALLSQA